MAVLFIFMVSFAGSIGLDITIEIAPTGSVGGSPPAASMFLLVNGSDNMLLANGTDKLLIVGE
jgi:hypothetical protein